MLYKKDTLTDTLSELDILDELNSEDIVIR